MVPRSGDRFAQPVSMILPRSALAPLLLGGGELGQQLFRRDSFHGRALRELLLNLRHHAEQISIAEIEPAVRAVATLIAGGVRPSRREPLEADPIQGAATRTAIQTFIERTDTSPDQLGVSALCHRFGVSRATLYRMFETDGGLVHYVRERQLRRALSLLASPAHRHRRVVDIALEHGFASESGFVRAFRRRFGATPTDVRTAPPAVAAGLHAEARPAASWLMALSASPLRPAVLARPR
jgi:AraC-like DNA-binding protein